MCTALHSDIDECLLQWFREARAQNIPINGGLLAANGEDLAKQLGILDFKCSESWIEPVMQFLLSRFAAEANQSELMRLKPGNQLPCRVF